MITKLKYFTLKRLSGRLGLIILSFAFTKRLSRLVSRPVSLKLPSSFSNHKSEMGERDLAIVQRLIDFWNLCQESNKKVTPNHSLWNAIQVRQDSLYNVFNEANPELIYNYLKSAPTKTICRGVLQGDSETKMLRANLKYRNLKAKITFNRFVSLLEGIGKGFIVQNPEQGTWGLKNGFNYHQAILHLDEEFGFKVLPPEVYNGLFQVSIGDRKFNQVDLMALNASLQIRSSLRGETNTRITEIGAGSGITAYWLHRMGLGPIQLIDLPHVAVLQAFYLLKSLPSSEVKLYGEEGIKDNFDFMIYPHFAIHEISDFSPTLVFNQDSFAEMPPSSVEEYLEWIVKLGARKLLSINHESSATYSSALLNQVNLSSLIKMKRNYKTLSRHPNWVRPGYIDQIWEINSS